MAGSSFLKVPRQRPRRRQIPQPEFSTCFPKIGKRYKNSAGPPHRPCASTNTCSGSQLRALPLQPRRSNFRFPQLRWPSIAWCESGSRKKLRGSVETVFSPIPVISTLSARGPSLYAAKASHLARRSMGPYDCCSHDCGLSRVAPFWHCINPKFPGIHHPSGFQAYHKVERRNVCQRITMIAYSFAQMLANSALKNFRRSWRRARRK